MTPPVGSRRELRSEVEPRIVERRRSVEAAGRQRRRRRGVTGAIAAAVLAAGVGAVFSPLADLDRVVVTGAAQLADEEVARVGGLEPGVALVTVDLAAARDRLRADPTIAAAIVEVDWPGTVRVSIVEERPVAALAVGDVALVVSDSGRVLGEAVAPDGLPMVELAGAEIPGAGERLNERERRVVALLGDLRPELAGRLVGVRLDRAGELLLDVDGGATVRFGPLEDVPAKLLAIETVFDRVVGECLAVLDVREPSRPAVSRSADCTPPEPTEALVDPPTATTDPTDSTADDAATEEPA